MNIYEEKPDKSFLIQDSIRGCMMAGAAGDALGYPVEFWKKSQIDQHYGAHGITQFKLMQRYETGTRISESGFSLANAYPFIVEFLLQMRLLILIKKNTNTN